MVQKVREDCALCGWNINAEMHPKFRETFSRHHPIIPPSPSAHIFVYPRRYGCFSVHPVHYWSCCATKAIADRTPILRCSIRRKSLHGCRYYSLNGLRCEPWPNGIRMIWIIPINYDYFYIRRRLRIIHAKEGQMAFEHHKLVILRVCVCVFSSCVCLFLDNIRYFFIRVDMKTSVNIRCCRWFAAPSNRVGFSYLIHIVIFPSRSLTNDVILSKMEATKEEQTSQNMVLKQYGLMPNSIWWTRHPCVTFRFCLLT